MATPTTTETHARCPDYRDHWYNKSSGDCSCGSRHSPLDRKPHKVCVLCRTEQPGLNRHGECQDCVDHAEGSSGF